MLPHDILRIRNELLDQLWFMVEDMILLRYREAFAGDGASAAMFAQSHAFLWRSALSGDLAKLRLYQEGLARLAAKWSVDPQVIARVDDAVLQELLVLSIQRNRHSAKASALSSYVIALGVGAMSRARVAA